MNILSLKFFKLLKRRKSKLASIIESQEKLKKETENSTESAYTLVATARKGRGDLLTATNMNSKHLEQASVAHRSGKARWIQSKNEQTYQPKALQLDKQLEFIYEELGLRKEMEKSKFCS